MFCNCLWLYKIYMSLVFKIKDEIIYEFVYFWKKVENEKGFSIVNIRSDHGDE
jgi:hypothetical protein